MPEKPVSPATSTAEAAALANPSDRPNPAAKQASKLAMLRVKCLANRSFYEGPGGLITAEMEVEVTAKRADDLIGSGYAEAVDKEVKHLTTDEAKKAVETSDAPLPGA